jgi:hypothetical protein
MRLSLPSTIASTTAVNEEKVKRRLSSRRQSLMKASKSNDENEAPNQPQGPTPYWKVRREKTPQCHAVQSVPSLTGNHLSFPCTGCKGSRWRCHSTRDTIGDEKEASSPCWRGRNEQRRHALLAT